MCLYTKYGCIIVADKYFYMCHTYTQRKNGQINALMKNHEKAFSDIKNYYNDITLNNLALINSLKVSTA